MGTFDEQRETETVETVRDITRFEFVVNRNHTVEEEYVDGQDEEGVDIIKTRTVDDGGPDLDLFVYVGGERTQDRRQVPRAKVIAGWPGKLRDALITVYNNAE